MRQFKIKPVFRTKFSLLFKRATLISAATVLGATSLLVIPPDSSYADFPNHEFDRTLGNRTVLDQPMSIATDSQGNIFITDIRQHVKKISPTGQFMMQFGTWGADDGQFASNSIRGIAIDSQDNVYVVDSANHRIQKFNSNGVFVSKIGTGVSGTGNGQLKNPSRIAIDAQDNLYVTDYGNNRIQKFTSTGTFVWKAGGTAASAVDGQFNQPVNIAIDSTGNIFVSDNGNYRIQEFTPGGVYVGKFGQRNTGVTCPAHPSLDNVTGLSFDSSDNLYVSSTSTWCDNVYKYTNANAYVGRLPIDNRAFRALHIDPASNKMYAAEGKLYISGVASWYELQEYDLAGTFIQGFGKGIANGDFRAQSEMEQDSSGNTYVIDRGNRRIQKFDPAGVHVLTFGTYGTGVGQFRTPNDIAVDASGNVFITDTEFGASKILKYDSNGTYVTSFGSSGSGPDQFSTGANTIAIGLNGDVYVTDRSSSRLIKQFSNTGTFIREIGTLGTSIGMISTPTHVDVSSTGELYVLNSRGASGRRVSVFDASGVYQREFTVRVSTPPDGSPSWHGSTGLELDSYDNVYIIDGTDGGLGILDKNGRFIRQFGSFGSYKSSSGSMSRNQYLMVGKNNEVFVNGDYDYIQIYKVASISAPPSIPLNHVATPGGNGTISLSWEAPATTNNSPLLRYETQYKPSNINQWVNGPSVPANELSIEITGLLQDAYDVRVMAVNTAGQSLPATATNLTVTAPYEYKQLINTKDAGSVHGIAFDAAGKRYETDNDNHRINVFAANGTYERSFGQYGSGDGEMYSPEQLAINSEGVLYVADMGNDRMSLYQLDGTYLSSFGTLGSGNGEMYYNYEIHIDAQDNIYVVNRYDNIQKYDKNGVFISRIATDLLAPTSMTFDSDGNMYIANGDYDTDHGIIKYNAAGTRLLKMGSEGEAEGQMYEIFGMVINPGGQLVVNDPYNYRLQTFTTDGVFVNAYGRGYGSSGEYMTFDEPETITQAANGDLYIPNGYSPYIQVLSYSGATTPAITTVPSTPQMVTVDVNIPNQATVKWTAPANDGGEPITSYKIEHKKSSEDSSSWMTVVVDGAIREHVINSMQSGCHDIRVSAGNANGYSPPTSLTCVTIADPAPIPSVEPSPISPTSPTPAQPTTPTPISNSPTSESTPTSTEGTDNTDSNAPSEPQPSVVTISPIEDASAPGSVVINWLPPANTATPPSSYLIEYRDTSTTDASAPWQEASRTNGDQQSATITLPPGQYDVRVTALFPGEKIGRIILGVAKVSISTPITHGDGPAVASASPMEEDHTVRNWIVGCSALLTTASLFIIPLLWKRRRKKAQANTAQH